MSTSLSYSNATSAMTDLVDKPMSGPLPYKFVTCIYLYLSTTAINSYFGVSSKSPSIVFSLSISVIFRLPLPSVQINMNLIGGAIVAFVRSQLGNFCESRKLQMIQTHKTQCQKSSWHTGQNRFVSTCNPVYKAQLWNLSQRVAQSVGCIHPSRCCYLLSPA